MNIYYCNTYKDGSVGTLQESKRYCRRYAGPDRDGIATVAWIQCSRPIVVYWEPVKKREGGK